MKPKISHTPGPWVALGRFIYKKMSPIGICEVYADADAALVAAAPDLLKALKEMVADFLPTSGNDSEMGEKMRAIITKAEGKPK